MVGSRTKNVGIMNFASSNDQGRDMDRQGENDSDIDPDENSQNLPNISSEHEQDLPRQEYGEDTNQKSVLFIIEQILTLLKIALHTSSKVVIPALSQLLHQSIIPTIAQLYHEATPIRMQEWFNIGITASQKFLHILSQTTKGKEVMKITHTITAQTIHLLTSFNTRQILVDSVGVQVKAIAALRTPEMKAFLSSLPVVTVRITDALSSGEAKLIYHSMSQLVWNVIDLLGQDETTKALAELTAGLVHVLERERYSYGQGQWNRQRSQTQVHGHRWRKRSRKGGRRGVRVASLYPRDAAASNSKRRYERNQFISRTFTDRVLLTKENSAGDDNGSLLSDEEEDQLVEDAILSSLGDETGGTRDDDAWLTSLGRRYVSGTFEENDGDRDDNDRVTSDAASLPSKVILPWTKDKCEENSVNQYDKDKAEASVASVQLDDLEGAYENTNERRGAMDNRRSPARTSKFPLDNNDEGDSAVSSVDIGESIKEDFAIEDLLLDDVELTDSNESPTRRRANGSKNPKHTDLVHEDSSIDSPFIRIQPISDTNNVRASNDAKGKVKLDETARGTYSSVAHFYRALDDMQAKLKKKEVDSFLQQASNDSSADVDGENEKCKGTKHESPGVSKKKWKANAAAAAGAGNEHGQEVLCRTTSRFSRSSSTPTLFRPNLHPDHEEKELYTDTVDKNDYRVAVWEILNGFLGMVPVKSKILFAFIACAGALMCLVWFLLGWYGLYYLLFGNVIQTPSSIPSPNEIVIRIVHDVAKEDVLDNERLAASAAEAIERALNEEL